MSTYDPCRTGIHVCGIDVIEDEPTTIENFPMSAQAAKRLFEDAKSAFSSGDDGDMVVDLFIGGDCDTDFRMRRQDLEALRKLVRQT